MITLRFLKGIRALSARTGARPSPGAEMHNRRKLTKISRGSKLWTILRTRTPALQSGLSERDRAGWGNGLAAWLLIACWLFAQTAAEASGEKETNLVWGVAAMSLGSPCAAPPSADDLLSGHVPAVSLDHFYNAGGKDSAVTPTECRLAYDANSLFVVFCCGENHMSFPAVRQPGDWYASIGLPSDQDAIFPDKVDLFVQPDRKGRAYYQFAATLDGRAFGCEHGAAAVKKAAADDESVDASSHQKVNGFTATVTKQDRQWVVYFKIPWKSIGGMPRGSFGFLPVRSRWRNAEVSSPVAFDFIERAPEDLFIETQLSGSPGTQSYPTSLCQLPSGTLRWQRPARLTYPGEETRRQIWQMQLSLRTPTGADNFAQRLYLVQRWVDLLALEGFNFRSTGGSIVKENMMLLTTRRKVNEALEAGQMSEAWHWLDVYLAKLNEVSRDWFADGSPGDQLREEWQGVTELTGWNAKGNVLFLHGLAGTHAVELHLSLPKTGGVRIYGADEGYFKPADLLPLNARPAEQGWVNVADGLVRIHEKPFEVFFQDAAGKKVTQLGVNDLAFRFSPEGKILAVDVRKDLGPDESIYGFGERYDRFNENGNVLTLWGMDDWFGNTVGLMNETYKPIALFHSSEGYTVFDNSTYRLRADLGKTIPGQYRLTQQGPIFDYYFWIEPPEKALQSYTDLTGKPILPPKWAFEPWMGRTGRGWGAGPKHNAVAEEESVAERFASLDIPHSAIYSEGGGADSAELNRYMAAHGLKVLSWYWPVISPKQQAMLLPEIKPDKLPLLNAGSESLSRDLGYVDFTHPNAMELCRRWWNHRLSLGVAGSMVDFGDRVPEAAVFYDGTRGDQMHNFYAYDYHKTYHDVFQEKRGDDFILFGRAAAPGTQKFVAQFGGDHPANFAGLQSVLTGALNLSACGFSTWGSDLGGFLGWPEPAVYMRWTQFACFSPLMRCHGRTPREPWNYGDIAVDNYKYYTWVRENLLDYIYDAAVNAHSAGLPIMKSLPVAYPDEPGLSAVKDEYLFGNDLLVAPVVDDENARTVYFPAGQWTSLWNGTNISGPAKLTMDVPPEEIPVYLKPGAVVSVQLNPDLAFGESMTRGRVDAILVTVPEKTEEVSFLNRQGEKIGVSLRPASHGFSMTMDNLSGKTCLLIYGAVATDVKMEGQSLPRQPGLLLNSQSTGWQNDPAHNRVIVHLQFNHARQGTLQVEIQSQNSKQ